MIVRSVYVYIITLILFLGTIFFNFSGDYLLRDYIFRRPLPSVSLENHFDLNQSYLSQLPPPLIPSPSIPSLSILFPEWQVLVVLPPEHNYTDFKDLFCIFPTNEKSPAKFSGELPFPTRPCLICELPTRVRRRLPFPEPTLVNSSVIRYPPRLTPVPDLLRWDFIVYDVLLTKNDVVVFVKGVNRRQGVNRTPQEFNCVFGDDLANAARTPVTTSLQEVFRCHRPDLSDVSTLVRVSLEFTANKMVMPSIAYEDPGRKLAVAKPKSLLCACTMVFNVAKFLREWVIYHSKIGVEKFIFYDNGSSDELYIVLEKLVEEGYNITTNFWLWPKTQEAGFSHCAISEKDACTWMMYTDVDEFVYSRNWANSTIPSESMLRSILKNVSSKVGELMIGCHEFGPSDQKEHPALGVMQGYNCRKKMENRHKSIVLLDAISDSLNNAVHHFDLKQGYKARRLSAREVVINHYKFQAWPEFKAKFRRRVSAYVVDWKQALNAKSNDRVPGLGFSAVEPKGWPQKFCEVHDNELKILVERWFGVRTVTGYHMAWERR
ncbi:hypothetical protein ACET3Z_015580 [Daucus carota]